MDWPLKSSLKWGIKNLGILSEYVKWRQSSPKQNLHVKKHLKLMSLSMRKIKKSHFRKWEDWHTYTNRYFVSSCFYIFQNISGWTYLNIGRNRQRAQTHYRTTFPGSIFILFLGPFIFPTLYFPNNTFPTGYPKTELSKTDLLEGIKPK